MARIRTLKPELWQHEKIGRLSRDERLLFIVLITQADDDGRLRELPRAIIGDGYPHDRISERQVEKWLAALERERLIVRYGCGRERFIALRGWQKHQRIDRYRPSTLPAPDGFSAQEQGSLDLDSSSPRRGLDAGSGIKDLDRGSGSQDHDREDPPSPPQAGGVEARDFWGRVKAEFVGAVSEFTMHTWIEPIEVRSFDGRRLVLAAPDHIRTWIEDSFLPALRKHAVAAAGHEVTVEIEQPEPARRRRRRAA
jgi:hypothetical protein